MKNHVWVSSDSKSYRLTVVTEVYSAYSIQRLQTDQLNKI